MSLFYFDVADEHGDWPDETGTELPDSADLCAEALGLLVDLAKDGRVCSTVKTVAVRDAHGDRVFQGQLSLTGVRSERLNQMVPLRASG